MSIDKILSEVKQWFEVNGLRLNSSKTKLVKFQTQQNKK